MLLDPLADFVFSYSPKYPCCVSSYTHLRVGPHVSFFFNLRCFFFPHPLRWLASAGAPPGSPPPARLLPLSILSPSSLPGAAGPQAGGGAGAGGNKLLAGYLAHEFLRRGTLLGERRLQPSGRKEKEPALAVPARRFRGCSWLAGPASPASSTPRSSALAPD